MLILTFLTWLALIKTHMIEWCAVAWRKSRWLTRGRRRVIVVVTLRMQKRSLRLSHHRLNMASIREWSAMEFSSILELVNKHEVPLKISIIHSHTILNRSNFSKIDDWLKFIDRTLKSRIKWAYKYPKTNVSSPLGKVAISITHLASSHRNS